jgi:hypothetical protein
MEGGISQAYDSRPELGMTTDTTDDTDGTDYGKVKSGVRSDGADRTERVKSD